MKEIKNSHNNLFIKTFSDIANVKDFISGALPPEIIENIDPGSARVEPTSFVEDSLSSHLSDLVIKLKANDGKRDFDLYLLFEHKSYVDEKILWQLLKYQYLMFEEDHNAKRKFRTIIPVVFYHGRGKWKISKSFSESINMPEYLKKYALNFFTNQVEEKELVNIMKAELGEEAEEIMPSLGNQILQKGRLEGIEKGAFQKAVETCKVALSKGFDLQTVIQLTGLPLEKVLEIQKSLKIN